MEKKSVDTKDMQPICDETLLTQKIGGNGTLSVHYGGYEIIVTHPETFRWAEVFEALLSCHFEVSITRRENTFVINAK